MPGDLPKNCMVPTMHFLLLSLQEKQLCRASCTDTYFKGYIGQSGGRLKISCPGPEETCATANYYCHT